jgi:8-oxo-dGTP pyrophosphatase MutT (NUDIX family)
MFLKIFIMSNKKEGLFNPPTKETIMAYNLSGELKDRKATNFRFRLSVYGLLVENSSILFHSNPDIEELCLPGGAVEIDETMEEALQREFLEETGISIEIIKQLITIEDFLHFRMMTLIVYLYSI